MFVFVKNITRLLTLSLGFPLLASATTFSLPNNNNALIGEIQYTTTENGETPAIVAQRYNIGMNAIIAANPSTRERMIFAPGTPLKIASQFLLPPLARKGIVINLPEMRMYYYLDGGKEVMTFPVGIGQIGKTIPIKTTWVTRKIVNPTWTPTESIRKFNEAQGIKLPRVMQAGPDNPLGPYAIYLQIPTYLIHSTIFPESIGRRASFGCIRMNESDIKQFFPVVTPGVPVVIVDMPNKVAWEGDQLYLEAHHPLEERSEANPLGHVVRSIQTTEPANHVTLVNWQLVSYLLETPDGVPHEVGVMVK